MRKLMLLLCLLPTLVIAQITQTQVDTEIDNKLSTQIRPVDIRFVTKFMTRYIRQADSTANTVPQYVKDITTTNIANWSAAYTATSNGSFVTTSGNQTGLSGSKTWTNAHTFASGINTVNITRGSTANLDVQQSGTSSIIARFQQTTGNLHLQSPGTAPTETNNRLTVDGTTLLNGLTTVGGNIVATGNSLYDLGTASIRFGTFWGLNFLNSSVASFGTTNTGSSILFRQGNANQIVGGYFATSGNAYDQAPGLPPADNGYRRSIYGTLLTTGRADFTGNYSDYQAMFGQTGQAGNIGFNNGSTGTPVFQIGYLNAVNAQPVITSSGISGLLIRATNAAGGLTFQTGGSNNRLTIDNTGLTSILGASTHAGTASFTDTWANRQAIFGSAGQGGSVQFSRGSDGVSGLRVGMTTATSSTGEIIAGDMQLVANTQNIRLMATNAAGSVTIASGGTTPQVTVKSTGILNLTNVPTYADNAAATTGGLVAGDVYRTATGQLMIRY